MTLAGGLFLAAALFILYTLFGYPLMLAALARSERPIRRKFQPRTVSVLLPVRNGEKWIREKLESILALHYPPECVRILVISDGSTDRTETYAREFEGRGVQVFSIPAAGKAVALNALMEKATGEILFFTDVRQRLESDSLRNLVACFEDPSVGVVSGELVILDSRGREDTEVGLYWKYEKAIRKRLSRIDSIPGATGCIYAMRRELARPLPADCLLDDVHLPMAAFFAGRRLIVEESAKAFDGATSLQTEFRRKVRTLAGVYQIVFRYPQLLGPRNRMWIHFFSHKLARLLLPFALLVLAVTSFWLPGVWAPIAILAQVAIYALAAADPWLPRVAQRVSGPARTFVILMLATFCASSILILPASRFWSSATGSSGRERTEPESNPSK
jgi:cellulose synthase/poly-beta-1,6-N-acetylglucosamine synthase-like glycosyltransferase